ncbi:LPS export ABC transporter permease LptG [Thermodesulfobacteriota bacterium]
MHRYIIQEILKYFCIVLVLVLGIFVAIDYLGNMDEFIESNISFFRALQFVFLKIPFMIVLFIPVGILLAVLVVFGLMSKNNEMLALKTCGIGIYYLLKPIVILGFGFGLLLFILSEVVVPITISEANRIQKIEIRKQTALTLKEKNIWIKGNRSIAHIKYYNPADSAIFGITLNFFDKSFRLIRRTDAKEGFYQKGKWTLSNVIEQVLDKETGKYIVTFHQQKIEMFDFEPADLKRIIKRSEEMSLRELFQYVKKVEAEGYDATSYRVDLHAKTAFPFICIIMCLTGTGIAARTKAEKGLPMNIALGIGTAFLYWIFYSFCLSLGRGEMLPPVIAAWMANIVFFCFGIFILQSAE